MADCPRSKQTSRCIQTMLRLYSSKYFISWTSGCLVAEALNHSIKAALGRAADTILPSSSCSVNGGLSQVEADQPLHPDDAQTILIEILHQLDKRLSRG